MSVKRLKENFSADSTRVILQTFALNDDRALRVINRVLALSDKNITETLEKIFLEFKDRHRNIQEKFLEKYNSYSHLIDKNETLAEEKKLLIGAYLSKEYSIEAAALFNPSIVPHPDQSGIEEGELKFIMSLRATGEGHISSVEFREGIISKSNEINMIPATKYVSAGKRIDKKFSKDLLLKKCINQNCLAENVLDNFKEEFKIKEYDEYLEDNSKIVLRDVKTTKCIEFLDDYIDSNYEVIFGNDLPIAERVLFPSSKYESMGMEDVRFVKFVHEDQSIKYYGTYTAYNGKTFRTQLIETNDFNRFQVGTMTGEAVYDKGLALFPRKIHGKYFMISRQDGENIYLMSSNDLYHWDEYIKIMEPKESWEFIQLGNCGSPIETEKGWLVITHAVGPLRKYVISAILLDLENPSNIIGRLKTPLLSPEENEREGYVPNVVYSCGSLIHNKELIIPYAKSDAASGFAKIDLNVLLNKLIKV